MRSTPALASSSHSSNGTYKETSYDYGMYSTRQRNVYGWVKVKSVGKLSRQWDAHVPGLIRSFTLFHDFNMRNFDQPWNMWNQ